MGEGLRKQDEITGDGTNDCASKTSQARTMYGALVKIVSKHGSRWWVGQDPLLPDCPVRAQTTRSCVSRGTSVAKGR